MKPIVVIGATALIGALIAIFMITAVALSCDCGGVCVNANG